MEPWHIELLGGLRLNRSGTVVTRFRTQRVGSLLAYLAYFPGRSHARDVLTELLWPEEGRDAARGNLSTALWSLRQQLEPEGIQPSSVLIAGRSTVELNREAFTTDVEQLEELLKKSERSETTEQRLCLTREAVELYRGELLPGFFEAWIAPEQARWTERVLGVLAELVDDLSTLGQDDVALNYALRAVCIDPLREETHLRVMRLHQNAGHFHLVLRQYQTLEEMLREELDAVPGPGAQSLLQEAKAALRGEISPRPTVQQQKPQREMVNSSPPRTPEFPRGAVPLHSPFYVTRPMDEIFHNALSERESIVLLTGPRQVGKTSLLGRGLHQARAAGTRVLLTDFQKLDPEQLATGETLLYSLAEWIAEQLELELDLASAWDTRRGSSRNFERFLRREVLSCGEEPVIWGIDEADRLFSYPYCSSFFGLLRSWHNERVLDPSGPWSRFTLALAYAAEAQLFISDVNQSPFNVGVEVLLKDFTLEQVTSLNQRYGHPLPDRAAVAQFMELVGGHPYLVRRGLYELKSRQLSLAALEQEAVRESGPFGSQLRRLSLLLARDPELGQAVKDVLQGRPCRSEREFSRLMSAGILSGAEPSRATLRCRLYADYLRREERLFA